MDRLKLLRALGKRIQDARKHNDVNQVKLARACGMDKATLSRIEAGKTNISYLMLRRISKALGINAAALCP